MAEIYRVWANRKAESVEASLGVEFRPQIAEVNADKFMEKYSHNRFSRYFHPPCRDGCLWADPPGTWSLANLRRRSATAQIQFRL